MSTFEIIIVNNDPDDSIPAEFRVPGNTIVVAESKPGSYAARNKAIRCARGDLLAFTDADCLPQPDWLTSALLCFDKDRDISRVGGKIELMIPSQGPLSMIQIYEKVFGFRQRDYVSEQGMAATANMIARKEVFDKVGLFDESLMSGGDAEWGGRANALGCKIVYCDACVVRHPPRPNFSAVVQKARREMGGKFLLSRESGVLRQWIDVILGFLPPVSSIRKVWFDKNYTLAEKIIAFGLRYLLRMIVHFEKTLLLLSLKKVERI